MTLGIGGDHESVLPCRVGGRWLRQFSPRSRHLADHEIGACGPGKLLRQHLDLSQFHRRRLSAHLRTFHGLRDARRGPHVQHQRRALEPCLRQRHAGPDQQAEQRLEMAVVAEQHQPVRHRHQDVAAARLRLVARRHARSGLRPDLRLPVQLAARASDEQWQAARAPKRQRQLEPRRPMGQFAILPRLQQQNLRDADWRAGSTPSRSTG